MQRSYLKFRKSITGSILVALGVLIFSTNLNRAVIELSHAFGVLPRQALGVLPALILYSSRAVQACPNHHPRFLHIFLWHDLLWNPLASLWPLLLVVVGFASSLDSFTD